jgi:hypothetical protein
VVSPITPQIQIIGGNFVTSFNQPAANGITYTAEWSTRVAPGNWAPIADTGIPPQHTFAVPIGAVSQIFVRLKTAGP